ncbi:exopolyphosphatase/guanosine-5'-triphosphate,3'-diphosphate pyrophosphatase [Arthrobacter stackebrandtii]|uniref:Exopolyphosphatase/guanosine-5'-triphosphate, 3'-diphosphate pyrophosphatase n=1 Tax=Arthrobacter stackebrandtii TaxID=272161 RepID=A0ABS4YS78_9MICC|nr:Ppx/GppA phosphatase family protein [Arthrobacter stackebrandtii]MBP2411656.1 exopolyphosphatase/guanosine-5'-triphosphate,3'-diphosphate pyrophosphatase [Arthrobacter stackebrandtii]PYG99695.1 exopolyphosphatase [Arthrobacter stackebrandtii]
MRVAAIDCGTNSIRLLIADVLPTDDGGTRLSDVHRLMRVVRLGEGVDVTGILGEAALERTFAALDEYAELIRSAEVDRVRFVATSATRDARNRDVFVAGVRARLGIGPEVVSGNEEAALSFAGAASVLPLTEDRNILVVDLGGGSTEFVMGTASGVGAALSTDMGCVRFTERYLRSDPPTEAEITAAEAAIAAKLDEVLAAVPLGDVDGVVGVAGTITTITAHALGLAHYQPEAIHAAVVPLEKIDAAATSLLGMTRAERSALGFMHPGRVDVIGAGALIWRTVLRRLAAVTGGRVESATTSEHDILDGIALGAAKS